MSSKLTLPLILGFVIVAAATGALYFALPPDHFATGAVAGVGVAYLGFLIFYFLLPQPGSGSGSIKSYLAGAAARYVVMVGAFCSAIFLLKIDTLGVLLGTFAGMMVSTFVSIKGMRQVNKPPES